jgi:hypothetical protein
MTAVRRFSYRLTALRSLGAVALLATGAIVIAGCGAARPKPKPAPSRQGIPVNISAPRITGYATPNSELSVSRGTWRGAPTSYSYRWQDCNASRTSCSDATGATSGACSPTADCYVVTTNDALAGKTLAVMVTASNEHGPSTPVRVIYARPASPSQPVACALSHVAGSDGTRSCWAVHTGVTGATGYTEAQIEAGAPGFTHVRHDVTITQPGAVIDHQWITGCLAIAPGATDVTIRDSLITPGGASCSGGGGGSEASAVNNGQSDSSPTGLLVEDTTIDGANVGDYGVSIVNGSCIRCNAFGFADNFWSGANGAGTRTVFVDTYSHDLATGLDGAHEQAFMFEGASHVTLRHDYAIASAGNGFVTAALNLQDWAGSGPTDVVAENNYLEGVTGVDLIGSCASTRNRITDNAFSSHNGYGGHDFVSYFRTDSGALADVGNTWTRNYVAEAPTVTAPPDPGTGGC